MIRIALDEEQLKAVKSINGYFLCLAGAGTGKTRVLAARTAYLIESGVSEEEIPDLTYTKKARGEMEARIATYLDRPTVVTVSTFHSFCFSYLAMFRNNVKEINIIDEDDRKDMVKRLIKTAGYKDLLNTDITATFISHVKNKMKYEPYGITRKQRLAMIQIYFKYQQECIDNNRLDFDQMAYEFLEFLNKNPNAAEGIASCFRYIMVDECQDMNRVQYEIIELLSSYHKNLYLVGDQDQTIYEWRGSDPNLMTEYVDTYHPTILPLLNNYRCDGYIVEAGNKLISHNKNRIKKELRAIKPKKNPIKTKKCKNMFEEANEIADFIQEKMKEGYKPGDFKVLFKMNVQSTFIQTALRARGIKFELSKLSLFEYKIVKTLIHYLRFLATLDDASILEVINYPTRGIGEATVNQIIRLANEKNITRFEACKLIDNDKVQAFVKLSLALREAMEIMKPVEFIDYLMNKLNYSKIIEKSDNSRNDQIRVDAFHDSISMYELKSDDYRLETLNMINELFLENDKNLNPNEAVGLMTIHQAKGLEAKIVIIAGFSDRAIPGNSRNINEYEGERRVAYVGITRTIDHLFITGPQSFHGQSCKMSPFLGEMLEIKKKAPN